MPAVASGLRAAVSRPGSVRSSLGSATACRCQHARLSVRTLVSASLLTAAERFCSTRSSLYSDGCALQRLGTPGMGHIASTRVVPPQPPVPCGGPPLLFGNVRVRRRHRDLERSASAVVAGRQVCGSPSGCATRRRQQGTATEDAWDRPLIDPIERVCRRGISLQGLCVSWSGFEQDWSPAARGELAGAV